MEKRSRIERTGTLYGPSISFIIEGRRAPIALPVSPTSTLTFLTGTVELFDFGPVSVCLTGLKSSLEAPHYFD